MTPLEHQTLTITENTKRLAKCQPLLPATLKHGRGGYTRGCRCTVCVVANRQYQAEYKKAVVERAKERIKAAEVYAGLIKKPAVAAPKPAKPKKKRGRPIDQTPVFYVPPRRVELPEEPIFALPVEAPRPPMSRADVQASVDEGLITHEEALSLAGPPPPVLRLVHAPRRTVPTTGVFKGSCKAVCAETGLKCRLPAHSELEAHASERGKFRVVAAPGQTAFPRRDALDAAAMAGNREDVFGSATGRDRAQLAEYRARHESKRRNNAHFGAETTTGLEGRKAYEARVKARTAG